MGGDPGKLGPLRILGIKRAVQSQEWILDKSVQLDEQEHD